MNLYGCFTNKIRKLSLTGLGTLLIVLSACTQTVELPKADSSWTRSFRFEAVADESVLYIPPLDRCRFLHAFQIRRQQPGEVRLYSVNKSILPDGVTAIPLHKRQQKYKRANPMAAALLGDTDTRILYVGNRVYNSVSLPMGTGLLLRKGESLMLEVHRPSGEIEMQLTCLEGAVEEIEVMSRHQSIALDPELPMAGSVKFALTGSRKLVWLGVLTSGPVQKVSLILNGRKLLLGGMGDAIPDFVFPDLLLDVHHRPQLHCVFFGGKNARGSCGAIMYLRKTK